MLRLTLVSCLVVVASGDLPKCTIAQVKQVINCIGSNYQQQYDGCLTANKCPENYNSERHDRKKRATVDVKLPPVNASKLTLPNSSPSPLINVLANASNSILTAASKSIAPGISAASNSSKLVNTVGDAASKIAPNPQQIMQIMHDCQSKLDDMVAQKVFSCVFSTNVTLADFFQFNTTTQSTTQKQPFNSTTCKAESCDICLDGRDQDDIFCPIQNQCARQVNCDVQGTVKRMGECFNNINAGDFSKIFTSNKSISFTLTDSQIKGWVESSRQKYFQCQVQPIPKKGCNATNIAKISQCVQDRESRIEQCYYASGCNRPLPKADMNMSLLKNVSAAVMECGREALKNVTKNFLACTKRNISDFGLPGDDNDDDDDSSESDNGPSNGNYGNSQAFGNGTTCDKAALNACLGQRNDSGNISAHVQICGDTCTDCDVKYTKLVACDCMKDQFLNPVHFNAMKISVQSCVAKSNKTYLTPQQEQVLINQILSTYCDGDVKSTNSAPPPPPPAAATPKPTTKKPTPTTKKTPPTTKKTPTTTKKTLTTRKTTPKPTTKKSG
jgi:hypothetical protein